MKSSHYDVLQVSNKASPAVIEGAYQNLKPLLSEQARNGDQEARNQLLFIEEAYAVLSSPEKRAAYDAAQSSTDQPASYQRYPENAPAYRAESGLLDSMSAKLILGIGLFAAVFSAYKFIGQHGEQKIMDRQLDVQSAQDSGSQRNNAYRAENERILFQGAVQNQGKSIDRSYDVAAREAERRKAELEYQANANAKALELQQQRLDAQLQQQRWAQEQYEKDRQQREARIAAEAPKKQLCNMYALNGNTRDARAAGCPY